MTSGEIELEHVSKRFGSVVAVSDLDLRVEPGEFMVLVGPSGCGKSTLLRMVAGLEEPTTGRIFIAGRDVTWLEPKERDIAMVFQSYALFPHMTVAENIGFGLRMRKHPRSEITERVRAAARVLEIDHLLDRRPQALSGGQRQRVAMGRALVRDPQAFLMDEPLSNLDAQLRGAMRAELRDVHQRIATTTLYVTHDQVEAMTLGDRVAALRDGVLQQVDTPRAMFTRPANVFVAAFIGTPAMNLLEANIADGRAVIGELSLPLASRAPTGPVIAGLRPAAFQDASLVRDDGLVDLEVIPRVVEDLGDGKLVRFPYPARAVVPHELRDELGAGEAAQAVLTAAVSPRSSAHPGQPLRLVIDPAEIHLFDSATGQRLAA